MAKKRNQITPTMFDCVKKLLTAGSTYAELHDYFGLGQDTIARIKRSQNYEEYKQELAAICAKARAKAAAKEVTKQAIEAIVLNPPAPEATPNTVKPVMMPYSTQKNIMDSLREQNQLLREQNQIIKEQTEAYKTLSAKMVFIIEQLA